MIDECLEYLLLFFDVHQTGLMNVIEPISVTRYGHASK